MKKILLLFALFPILAFGQHTTKINKANGGGIGDLMKSDTTSLLATQHDLATAVAPLEDTVALETIITLQADTVPLFVFGLGSGIATDTAVFQTNANCGTFFNKGSDTLVITDLHGIIMTGSGTSTVSVQLWWNDTLSTTVAAKLNTSALAITSTTVRTVDASFLANEIPPNMWVWMTAPTISVGNRPKFLSVTISGHKKNRKY